MNTVHVQVLQYTRLSHYSVGNRSNMEIPDFAPEASLYSQWHKVCQKKEDDFGGFQWYRVFHHEDNFDGLNIHSCLDLKKKPKLNHRWA
ncbi:unnamed protein product [Brassica rapa subsp. trilocularis]